MFPNSQTLSLKRYFYENDPHSYSVGTVRFIAHAGILEKSDVGEDKIKELILKNIKRQIYSDIIRLFETDGPYSSNYSPEIFISKLERLIH